MINESKGTPDIIREIVNENSKSINLIILNGIDKSLNLEINKSSNQKKGKVLLNCILNINFYFTDSKNYNGNIKFYKCIESDFKDCEINIYLPNKNLEKISVYKSLIHELTHLYELYQIKDIFDKTSWRKSMNLNIYDDEIKSSGLIRYFRDIFYASLPHEIRSNLSSLGIFLIGLRSKDEKYLRDELKKTTEWSRYKAISEFNPKNYLIDLLNRYDLDFIINSFNIFNKVLEISANPIVNKEQLLRYFNNWKRYFSDISKKYKSKIDSKIKNVIKNDENEYGIEIYEDKILKYSDYLKDDISNSREVKLDELLKIDYLKYFENWDPVINKDVNDFINQNKTSLLHLWDKEKSEEENMEFLKNYFTENPDLMNDKINLKDIAIPQSKFGLKNSVPILQNTGGVNDFRSF
jgi:hypothetical protein